MNVVIWVLACWNPAGTCCAAQPALRALEYHIPKLARTEVAGEVNGNLTQCLKVEFVSASPAHDARINEHEGSPVSIEFLDHDSDSVRIGGT